MEKKKFALAHTAFSVSKRSWFSFFKIYFAPSELKIFELIFLGRRFACPRLFNCATLWLKTRPSLTFFSQRTLNFSCPQPALTTLLIYKNYYKKSHHLLHRLQSCQHHLRPKSYRYQFHHIKCHLQHCLQSDHCQNRQKLYLFHLLLKFHRLLSLRKLYRLLHQLLYNHCQNNKGQVSTWLHVSL